MVSQACYHTDTKCACSLNTEPSSDHECFEPVAPIAKEGLIRCKSRICHQQYVCDCAGNNICHYKTGMQTVLEHVDNDDCKMVRKKMTVVKLESRTESGIEDSLLNLRRSCLFTDNICSCSSTVDVENFPTCLYFVKNDPVNGDLCQFRDCKESMQCDCAGKKVCSRRKKTLESWKSMGTDPSSGLVKCQQVTSTYVELL